MTSTEGRRKRARWRLAAVAGGVLPLLLAGYAAFAAVSPTPETAVNGNAGYDARTTNPAGFTDVQDVNKGNQYGLTIKGGAQGVQLCNTTTNFGAQIGVLSSNLTTVYSVASAVGTIPAPGCPSGGVIPGGVVFPGLAAVPYDHHVWIHAFLTTKVKRVKILVCILEDHQRRPVPTPSPSLPVTPAASASSTATASTAALVRPYGTKTATPSPSTSTSVAVTPPTPTPSVSTTSPAPTTSATSPAPTPTPSNGGKLPGFFVKCFIIVKVIQKQVVTFEAQDLDAPVTVPVAGDLPGVQTRFVHVPAGTVFDEAGAGINENLTTLTACAGVAADGNTYPRTLLGPAAYISAACQPVDNFAYATATAGSGTPQDFASLTTQEGISPAGTATNPALVAPNNTLRLTVPADGPHGTASDASTTGSSAQLNTGNAPTA